MPTINKPSIAEVTSYLKLWDSLDNYVLQESSLKKLFLKTSPMNDNLDDVLIKVCVLNDFYSTHILSPFTIAKHIVRLNIDRRLNKEDLSLVNDIANVRVTGGKRIKFYSFASKYCSHHKPNIYPIYDSYVEKMLMYFKKVDHFYKFKKIDLKNYPLYQNILVQFRKYYGLEGFNLKQIDKYLWQAGKKHYKRKYQNG